MSLDEYAFSPLSTNQNESNFFYVTNDLSSSNNDLTPQITNDDITIFQQTHDDYSNRLFQAFLTFQEDLLQKLMQQFWSFSKTNSTQEIQLFSNGIDISEILFSFLARRFDESWLSLYLNNNNPCSIRKTILFQRSIVIEQFPFSFFQRFNDKLEIPTNMYITVHSRSIEIILPEILSNTYRSIFSRTFNNDRCNNSSNENCCTHSFLLFLLSTGIDTFDRISYFWLDDKFNRSSGPIIENGSSSMHKRIQFSSSSLYIVKSSMFNSPIDASTIVAFSRDEKRFDWNQFPRSPRTNQLADRLWFKSFR